MKKTLSYTKISKYLNNQEAAQKETDKWYEHNEDLWKNSVGKYILFKVVK